MAGTMRKSSELFKEAKHFIPGGVNSPVRAFRGVGGDPLFIERGVGSKLIDVDGNEYIDYVGSWGPLVLGHAYPSVIEAVKEALSNGLSFGAPVEKEVRLAEMIVSMMPSIEKVRMVNSGTEATMTAIRLARGVTKRDKFIKFRGCYHGHSDSLLVEAGSGLLTLGIPSTPGIPKSVAEHTLVADFNRLDEVEMLFNHYPNDIAAVILEPIAGNMGFVLPDSNFLSGLRSLCDKHGTILIFDEVMTGFRVAKGGAQAYFNITPDLTTLGKIIGGGMPVGAVGGRRDIMSHLAPEGDIYQAGTLSGNPLAMAAGIATLKELEKPGFYEHLSHLSQLLIAGLKNAANEAKIPFYGASLGGMFGFCFSDADGIRGLDDVRASDQELFKQFYHGMLSRGVYFAPSLFEAGFISSAHTEKDIRETVRKAGEVFSSM